MDTGSSFAAVQPWWLARENECDFCTERYAFTLEVHCTLCDRECCPLCAVWIRTTQEMVCPVCDGERER